MFIIKVNELISLRNNTNETSEVFDEAKKMFDEPYEFPLIMLTTFAIILFLDGKFIQNGFLNNLRIFFWLRVKQSLKLNVQKKIYHNFQK